MYHCAQSNEADVFCAAMGYLRKPAICHLEGCGM